MYTNNLQSYENLTLDSFYVVSFCLQKAIRTAASICAEYKRSLISSSGILPALAKLATDFRRTNRSIISTHDVANTVPSLTQNVLTQAHVEFLQCCILASQYSIAKQFVDGNPIYSVPSVKGALSSESFLRYFYFLGMVHLACDDYTNAISAFQQCMTLPSKIVSAITIEARKKLLIAKCLMLFHLDDDEYENCAQPDIRQSRVKTAEGGPTSGDKSKSTKGGKICDIIFDLPYTASIPAVKSCSTTRSFKLYEKLVGDYLSIDVAEFTKTINEGAQTLTRDGNMGLVKQLIPLIQYRSLRNISKIYEAIPMAKLATKLGFGGDPRGLMDTESYLLKVTLEQKNNSFGSPVDFTIDSESSIVYFYEVGYDDNDDPGCHATQVDLQKRVTTAMDLAERISKMDIAVTCSTKYQCCLASKNPEDSGEAKSSVISDM